jgi:hypothetical protein
MLRVDLPSRASRRTHHEDPIEDAARRVVDEATGERPKTMPTKKEVSPEVSAAAAAMSKLGASNGGEARAAKLSKKRRSEIAKQAAAVRWHKR